MLDSATRVFIDGGSVGAGLYKQKSNEANVNIIRDDVAAFVIDGADSKTAAELQGHPAIPNPSRAGTQGAVERKWAIGCSYRGNRRPSGNRC
ncbi:MAG: hypothetical protein CMK99_18355 [Pseudomonas sp.]|nr:hypothetical protein [Pseudomonas sp.]HBS77096.1 hypothetical protein [Pseudomonas sp.]